MFKNLSKGKSLFYTLFIFSFQIYAQEELKEKFKNDEMSFYTFKTSYEYYWDEQSNCLRVKHHDEISLVPLRTNVNFFWPIFFNDQTQLIDFELRKENGKKQKYQKICGHQGQDGIFHSDAKICTYSFVAETALKPINLVSERQYLDPRYFTKIFLPFFIPGKKRVVEIIWPDWIEVDLREFNFSDKNIQITEITKVGYKGKKFNWEWPDQIANESNTPSSSHFAPHIIPITKAYIDPTSGVRKTLLENTDNLYAWYKDLISEVLNEKDSLIDLVKMLTENKSENEQIKSIYYWVQDNIKYIAFENGIMGFRPVNAQEVLYKRYGDCKGMANLLKAMLEIAGFDARLTWLGTSHLPYTYEVPSLAVDNHMICSVIKGDETILLDATVKYNELKYAPGHIQGKQILIENGDDYVVKTVPVETSENNYEKVKFNLKVENEVLNVNGEISVNGDSKQMFLNLIEAIDKKYVDKFMREFVSKNADRDDFKVNIVQNNRDSVLLLDVINISPNNVNIYDREMYVKMEVRYDFSDMTIKKSRKNPYDFGRRKFIRSESVLIVPENYSVTELPNPLIEMRDGYRFELKYETIDGQVVYTKNIDIEAPYLTPNQFQKWNETVKKVSAFYNNPIVLIHDE